jgi:hypothetical protein
MRSATSAGYSVTLLRVNDRIMGARVSDRYSVRAAHGPHGRAARVKNGHDRPCARARRGSDDPARMSSQAENAGFDSRRPLTVVHSKPEGPSRTQVQQLGRNRNRQLSRGRAPSVPRTVRALCLERGHHGVQGVRNRPVPTGRSVLITERRTSSEPCAASHQVRSNTHL